MAHPIADIEAILQAHAARLERLPDYQAERLPLPALLPGQDAIAQRIDHTLLKPEATRGQIETLCQEARTHGFWSVCINPGYLPLAQEQLAGSQVRLCTVVGFPLGATLPEAKAAETAASLSAGAHEIDMVLNVGVLKSGDVVGVFTDIRGVVAAAHLVGALCKVILETALLTDEEKVLACVLAQRAGADFVKTSTGFSSGGATVEDIRLMRAVVGPEMGVKASGGVRNYADYQAMVDAGATRIGASAGVRILQDARGAAPSAPMATLAIKPTIAWLALS
ncbi:MAG: deoxyribose-phosphate aldolase [Anaerolineae bacterium]|nr:deoxyribose-phosphate aldolase [Anaerolineae bacterium]